MLYRLTRPRGVSDEDIRAFEEQVRATPPRSPRVCYTIMQDEYPSAAAPASPPKVYDQAELVARVEAEFWDLIKDSNKAGDFEAFLDSHPSGRMANAARGRLAELTPPPKG